MKKTFTIGVKVNNEYSIFVANLKIEENNQDPYPIDPFILEQANNYILDSTNFSEFKVEGVLPGKYNSPIVFKRELDKRIEFLQQLMYDKQKYEMELEAQEAEWNAYVQENYDFEYGDWKY